MGFFDFLLGKQKRGEGTQEELAEPVKPTPAFKPDKFLVDLKLGYWKTMTVS